MTAHIINYFRQVIIEDNRNLPWHRFAAGAIGFGLMIPLLGRSLVYFTGIEAWEATEELGKAIACLFGGWFAVISILAFSIGEMIDYVLTKGPALDEYGLYWNFVAFRAFCVTGHMSYLGIHWWGHVMARKQEHFLTRLNYRMIAFMLAWTYHMIHNNGWGMWVAQNWFGIQ